MPITIHEVLPYLIEIRGEPFNITDYKLFYNFYDSLDTWRTILKTGRQVGKTTGIAAKQIVKAVLFKHTPSLTVHPLSTQSADFSRLHIDSMFDASSVLKKTKMEEPWNLRLKQLTTGSILQYSYVGNGADRNRGKTAKDIYWDEIQNVVLKNIGVVEECAKSFKDQSFTYTGTAATMNNLLEGLWQRSSMSEPVIRCSRCNFENMCVLPEVYKMLKPAGLTCQKCDRVIRIEDVYAAYIIHKVPKRTKTFRGLHIPQIFTPQNVIDRKWRIIMYDYETYTPYEFSTEVLGISYDEGNTPITERELYSLCDEEFSTGEIDASDYSNFYMGVDWGYATARSYTVMCIVGRLYSGKFRVVKMKKFKYRNRLDQIAELEKYYRNYNCAYLGADAGVGLTDNYLLRDSLDNVFVFLYTNQTNLIKLNQETLEYHVSRSKSMGLIFDDLLNSTIRFPNRDESSEYLEDILHIVEEVRNTVGGSKKFYTHNVDSPDDFFHALNYAVMSAKIHEDGTLLDKFKNI